MPTPQSLDALRKIAGDKASPLDEGLAALPASWLMYRTVPGSYVIDPIAYLAGLADDESNSHKSVSPAFIPGVSAYRAGNRIKTQVSRELRDIASRRKDEGARPVAHAVAEHLGPTTSILASGALGAVIGRLARKGGEGVGGAAGLGIGAAATLVGMLAGAIRRRRTKQQQIESDKGSLLAKYLVPGLASHDYVKRIGRSQGERDEAEAAEKNAAAGPEEGFPGIWSGIKNWYKSELSQDQRNWVNAGIGALGLGLANKLTGGSFLRGAAIGGIGGALSSEVNWKAIGDALASLGSKKPAPTVQGA